MTLTFENLQHVDNIAAIIDGLDERVQVLELSAVPVNLQPITNDDVASISASRINTILTKLEALAPYYVDADNFDTGSTSVPYFSMSLLESRIGDFPRTATQDPSNYRVDTFAPVTADVIEWIYNAIQELDTTAQTDWSLTNVRAKFAFAAWDIPGGGPIFSWAACYAEAASNWPVSFTSYPDSDDYAFDGTSNSFWARPTVEEFNSGGFDNAWRNICGYVWYRGGTLGSPQITNRCFLIRKQGAFEYEDISTYRPHSAKAYVYNSDFDITTGFDSSQEFIDTASFSPFPHNAWQEIQTFTQSTVDTRVTRVSDSNGGIPPYAQNITPVESGTWRGQASSGWCCRNAILLTTWNFEV